MNENLTVGIYCRVSTQEQAREGYSIGEQEERLKNLCKAKDWIVRDVYVDGGYSGGSMDRPALKRLLADINKKKIDTVLVYKLDRLSRSQKDTLYLIEDIFIKQNIRFYSMTENLDTSTAFGRAMIGILSAFAQLEREQIRERSMMGKHARAKEGYFHGGGFAPIGYKYEGKRLIVDEYEFMQIRMIADLFVKEKQPIHAIASIMNERGYRHTSGKIWKQNSIRSCLFTPLYAGYISSRGELFEGKHIPVFTEEEFEEIQKEKRRRDLTNPYLNNPNPFKHTSILGGLLFCGNCGARYYCKHSGQHKTTKESYKFYMCYSRGKTSKKMVRDPNCKNPNFAVEKLDKMILDEIKKLSFDHGLIDEIIDAAPITDERKQISLVEERINEIDITVSRLVDIFASGKINMSDTLEKIDRLNEEKDSLLIQLDQLTDESTPPELDSIEAANIADLIVERIEKADTEELRGLVSALIEKIVIYDDVIKIYWKFV